MTTDIPVRIVLIDPWDLVTETGSGPFAATLTITADRVGLIRLQIPLWYLGVAWKYLKASPRHVDDNFDNLVTSERIAVNAIFLPDEPQDAIPKGNARPRSPTVIAEIIAAGIRKVT